MTTKIAKWGNSLGIRIPKEILLSLGADVGTEIEFIQNKNGFIIKPKELRQKKYSLKDLSSQITKKNRQEVVDWDKPVGREVW